MFDGSEGKKGIRNRRYEVQQEGAMVKGAEGDNSEGRGGSREVTGDGGSKLCECLKAVKGNAVIGDGEGRK